MKETRLGYRESVAAYFRARPGQWIDGLVFEGIGGKYAWRTRVSECRKLGMTIDNRQRQRHDLACVSRAGGECNCRPYTVSEYRFVPTPPAQETTTADLNAWSLT